MDEAGAFDRRSKMTMKALILCLMLLGCHVAPTTATTPRNEGRWFHSPVDNAWHYMPPCDGIPLYGPSGLLTGCLGGTIPWVVP